MGSAASGRLVQYLELAHHLLDHPPLQIMVLTVGADPSIVTQTSRSASRTYRQDMYAWSDLPSPPEQVKLLQVHSLEGVP